MPYNDISELPNSVTHVLPKHAQDIYKEAFNSAYQEYKKAEDRRGESDREETAHRVAWSAVKKAGYSKGDDDHWHQQSK